MPKLVIANFKMHGDKDFINNYVSQAFNLNYVNNPQVVIALPSIYLAYIDQKSFALAAQDVSKFSELGPYTGDIHVSMLADLAIKYCIIGHSERRGYYHETDEIILAKLNNCLNYAITPILCIGEAKEYRENGEYLDFINKQLQLLTKTNSQSSIQKLIIAYEPIWAIGSNLVATPTDVQEVLKAIRSFVSKILPQAKVSLIYGGSVKSTNVEDIILLPEVDGVLVGGACLNFEEFKAICQAARQSTCD